MSQFVVLHLGRRQIGGPTPDYKAAIQRAYDEVAAVDLKRLSRKEIEQLRYDIVEVGG